MDILAAIKREERKLEKQLGNIQQRLNGVRAAAKALGDSTSRELKGAKKRVLSAAGRAKIAKAAKKRWAKIRAQAQKVSG
jgi:hypothetical protein